MMRKTMAIATGFLIIAAVTVAAQEKTKEECVSDRNVEPVNQAGLAV
jgi:hypothetical protein